MGHHSGNRKESFGTIVFMSDLDLSKKEVYRIYCERWLLELMDVFYSSWRSAKDESIKPKDNDRYWIHTLSSVMEELVKLDFATCTKEKRSPRKTQEGKAHLRCTKAP